MVFLPLDALFFMSSAAGQRRSPHCEIILVALLPIAFINTSDW